MKSITAQVILFMAIASLMAAWFEGTINAHLWSATVKEVHCWAIIIIMLSGVFRYLLRYLHNGTL